MTLCICISCFQNLAPNHNLKCLVLFPVGALVWVLLVVAMAAVVAAVQLLLPVISAT